MSKAIPLLPLWPVIGWPLPYTYIKNNLLFIINKFCCSTNLIHKVNIQSVFIPPKCTCMLILDTLQRCVGPWPRLVQRVTLLCRYAMLHWNAKNFSETSIYIHKAKWLKSQNTVILVLRNTKMRKHKTCVFKGSKNRDNSRNHLDQIQPLFVFLIILW
jgi:hypothetical protein